MKKNILYILLLSFLTILFSACVNEDLNDAVKNEEGFIQLYFTTPSHSLQAVSNEGYYPETRGTHTNEEAKIIQDKINSIYILLFDEKGDKLKASMPMTKKGDLHIEVTKRV